MSQIDRVLIDHTGKETTPTRHRKPLYWEVARRIAKNKKSAISFLFLLLVLITAIVGPWIAPHDPIKSDYNSFLMEPSGEYLLGTDAIGRDVLSRLLHGTRTTLFVSFLAVCITFVCGTWIGITSAYIGGMYDLIVMRVMEVLLALPGIIVALAIVAVLGPSMTNAMIAVGISAIPSFAIMIRSAVLSVIHSGYMEASRSLGSSKWWIIRNQIIPNIASVQIVTTTLFMGGAILDTSALSFIGLGAQPPTPEWGTMLSEGKEYLGQAWWLITFPGITITAVVFAINMLGDALRDIFDPKSQE